MEREGREGERKGEERRERERAGGCSRQKAVSLKIKN